MFTFGTPTPKTVDSVLQAFNAAIADLETVAVDHTSQAVYHAQRVAEAQAAQDSAQAEASRATSIASKMRAVFA